MKIGIVLFGDLTEPSGGYLYDRHMVDALTRRGHEVTIVSQEASLSYRAQRRLGRREAAHRIDGAYQRVMDSAFDLLIVDELNHGATVPWLSRVRGRGTTIVGLVHHLRADEGLRYRWSRPWEARFLRLCDAWLCNSTVTLRRVCATSKTVRSSGVSFPGVGGAGYARDSRSPSKNPILAANGADGSALRLLFVGTIVPRKNIAVLLKAVALVPGVTLHIVGDTTRDRPYAARISRLVDRLGLAHRVALRGRLDSDELDGEYRWADLFAAPSRYEGFGIVYLEAMARGVPVIASRAGGARDLVTDGRDGFLVDPTSPRDIAAILRRLAVDRDLAVRLGAAARGRAERHESWERSMDGAVRFLEALGRRPHRTA